MMASLTNQQGYIARDSSSPLQSSWEIKPTPPAMPFPWNQSAEAQAASPTGTIDMMPRLPEYSDYLPGKAAGDLEASSVGDMSDPKKAR